MDIFCQDEKLNLSSYYMKPGFAFGGSCLPKDVRAMQYRAKEVDLDMPVIQSILGSNQLQIQHAIDRSSRPARSGSACSASASRPAPTTCARARSSSSPKRCSARATSCASTTSNVSIARLVGANKDYINQQIPHLSSLLSESIDEVLDESDVIVVGNGSPEFADALTRHAAGSDRSSIWCA